MLSVRPSRAANPRTALTRLALVSTLCTACMTGAERQIAIIPDPGFKAGTGASTALARFYFVDRPPAECTPVARAMVSAGLEDDLEDLLVDVRSKLSRVGSDTITLNLFSKEFRDYVVHHLNKPDEVKTYEALTFTGYGQMCGGAK